MRPIDADALLENLDKECGDLDLEYNSEYEQLVNYIESQPTLDYAPVRKGAWMFTVDHPRERLGFFACSECGIGVGLKTFNFCPNCGAKMDGGLR